MSPRAARRAARDRGRASSHHARAPRHEHDRPVAPPGRKPTPPSAGGPTVGCHRRTRDGRSPDSGSGESPRNAERCPQPVKAGLVATRLDLFTRHGSRQHTGFWAWRRLVVPIATLRVALVHGHDETIALRGVHATPKPFTRLRPCAGHSPSDDRRGPDQGAGPLWAHPLQNDGFATSPASA